MARQEFEITETDIRLARSAKKPFVEATASYGYIDQDNTFTAAPPQSLTGDTSNIGVSLTQPLFRGFQTQNAITRAQSTALASEFQLKTIEQQVFLEVITAYLDTQRDLAILNLSRENLETLQEQLTANEKRYALKDTSLTDVARSKSAVASAHSNLANARADYAATRSTFFRLTGLPAENLNPITSENLSTFKALGIASDGPAIPSSIDIFLKQSIEQNAAIISARYTLQASNYAVKEAKGARLPTIDFNSSLSRNERPENFGLFSDTRTTTSASAGISVSIPLYQAGQEFGNIKRAKQIRRLREIELMQTIAEVRDNSRIIWDRLEASKIAIISHKEAVKAAETAAFGTRKIYRAGLISAIDLIDTEQILLRSKIDYENARHDYLVATYTLLSIMSDISY